MAFFRADRQKTSRSSASFARPSLPRPLASTSKIRYQSSQTGLANPTALDFEVFSLVDVQGLMHCYRGPNHFLILKIRVPHSCNVAIVALQIFFKMMLVIIYALVKELELSILGLLKKEVQSSGSWELRLQVPSA